MELELLGDGCWSGCSPYMRDVRLFAVDFKVAKTSVNPHNVSVVRFAKLAMGCKDGELSGCCQSRCMLGYRTHTYLV